MNHLIKIFSIGVILLNSNITLSQQYDKEDLFIEFKTNDGSQPNYRGIKIDKKALVQFNNLYYGTFIYYKKNDSDTLLIHNLSKYKLTNAKEVDGKLITIRKKRLEENPDKILRPMNKNTVFNTYLIEILNKKEFVVYPVIWKNVGVQD